jgi:Lysylphosphatidylglycerol synthase TM region
MVCAARRMISGRSALETRAIMFATSLAGSLLSTIPFTPARLGAVEGASVAILTTFGLATSLAGAVAVVDRVINYLGQYPGRGSTLPDCVAQK